MSEAESDDEETRCKASFYGSYGVLIGVTIVELGSMNTALVVGVLGLVVAALGGIDR